jgi:flavin reductase (DIM6/NTAB) family NADH-FMN oxidoreductase RutF
MRTDFSPDELSSRDFYRLLTAAVVPRPIAWVSSTSADGVDNLAPHSFFTVASVNPPIIQFTSVGEKIHSAISRQDGSLLSTLPRRFCWPRLTRPAPTSPRMSVSSMQLV